MANVLFVLLETCTINTGFKHHNINFNECHCLKILFKRRPITLQNKRINQNTETIPVLPVKCTSPALKAGAVSLLL